MLVQLSAALAALVARTACAVTYVVVVCSSSTFVVCTWRQQSHYSRGTINDNDFAGGYPKANVTFRTALAGLEKGICCTDLQLIYG